MSESEQHELTCPDCGLTGDVKGQMVTGGFTANLNLGLDPENCEGCRRVLADAGYVETVIPPGAARMLLGER